MVCRSPLWHTTNVLSKHPQTGPDHVHISGQQTQPIRTLPASATKTWKLHQQSYARRATILKLITGWNVDGSRYALYTQDLQAKLVNARCPLCLAPDSDLHWICECPCPVLKEPRDTLIQETIPAHLRQILTTRNNIRNISFRSSPISAEHYVPASPTVRTANSFGREPRPPI